MAVVLAVPGFAAGSSSLTTGFEQTWTGSDGSVWDLNDVAAGVFLHGDDLIGLGFAPAERFRTESPSVAGSRTRGHRTLERPVTWPLTVTAGSALAFLELERSFWKTMRRGRTGVWTVRQQPTGQTRSIECMFVDRSPGFKADPSHQMLAQYTVALIAEDPYWRGETISREFIAATPADFIPGGGGPTFTISEASSLSSAAISNPGDVDVWPTWTVTATGAGITAVSVDVGGSELASTEALSAGDVMVIDTDPRRQSVTINGVRVRGVLSPHEFAPIPAGGDSVPLTVSITGTGSVAIRIVPKWECAW